MKKNTLTFVGIFIVAMCYSQTAIKKPSPAPGKPTPTIKSENAPVAKVKPVKILTPGEIRKNSVFELLSTMLDLSMMDFYSEQSYEMIPNKQPLFEYLPETDTSAKVYIKNNMNHTVNKLDITFDTLRVTRIKQFVLIKINDSDKDNNATWTKELANVFLFEYDSAGLKNVRRAQKGWEDTPYYVDKYYLGYKNGRLDSIMLIDGSSRKREVAYYNGKPRLDSIYNYSYQLPSGRVFFLNKFVYVNNGDFEIHKEVIEKYAGIKREKTICDTSHLILYEKRIENPLLHDIRVSIGQYKYDPNGLLSYTDQRNVNTENANEPTDSLIVKGSRTAYRSHFLYNEKNQVVKQIISYNDGCFESEETINYLIDIWGFIVETKSNKVTKNHCTY